MLFLLILSLRSLSKFDSQCSYMNVLFCVQDWYRVSECYRAHDVQWALQTKAVLDRLQLVLADRCQHYFTLIQPTAKYLGHLLRVDKHGVLCN